MVEFAINSSVNAASGFSPFDLNYGYRPILHAPTLISEFAGVRDFVRQAHDNLQVAHDHLLTARVRQTEQANKKRSVAPVYSVGGKVYLSTRDLRLPKGRARKLLPKFIGPFEITQVNKEGGTCTLNLPQGMKDRRIHEEFHVSRIRPYHASDADRFPGREPHRFYDFGQPDRQEWVVERILDHQWNKNELLLKVHWATGDDSWEPLENCEALIALDDYLALHGAREPKDLSRNRHPRPAKNQKEKATPTEPGQAPKPTNQEMAPTTPQRPLAPAGQSSATTGQPPEPDRQEDTRQDIRRSSRKRSNPGYRGHNP